MEPARPDTQIHLIDAQRGLIGGYAEVRGYRDLHGSYCDSASELLFQLFGTNEKLPAFNLATVQNDKRPQPSDVAGVVATWRADEIGLWAEVQIVNTPHSNYVLQTVEAGNLYFCFRHLSEECRADLETGYFARRVAWAINLTEFPTYRPSRWPDADSYLCYLLDLGLDLPPDVSSWQEETPLGGPLPEELFTWD